MRLEFGLQGPQPDHIGETGQGNGYGTIEFKAVGGFDDIGADADGAGAFDQVWRIISGQDDHGRRTILLDTLRSLETVHAGHRDVHDDNIRLEGFCGFKGLRAMADSGDTGGAYTVQQSMNHLADQVIVLSYQYPKT
jgi:hypothetical protein